MFYHALLCIVSIALYPPLYVLLTVLSVLPRSRKITSTPFHDQLIDIRISFDTSVVLVYLLHGRSC